MPYSVSPRRKDQSRGPNPTKYSVTFIPPRLAARKWPSSWTMTMTMIETTTMRRSACPVATARATMRATVPMSSPASLLGDLAWPNEGPVRDRTDGDAFCRPGVERAHAAASLPLTTASATLRDLASASSTSPIWRGGDEPPDPGSAGPS